MTDFTVLVIDGQGGGVGRQLVESMRKAFPQIIIMAVGTNALASQAMLKAGADHAATGENAVIVASRKADVIIGPVGIVIADALWGEISPAMAAAVGSSSADRILLPMNLCGNYVAGVSDLSLPLMISDAIAHLKALISAKGCL